MDDCKLDHTPGPWQREGSHVYGPDPQRRIILQLHYGGRGYRPEDAANERLILAAPDILAACREAAAEICNHTDGHMQQFRLVEARLMAAIAKAEGR